MEKREKLIEAPMKKCLYCGLKIKKARTPHRIGGRVWRWVTKDGAFYCPSAGGDCWHEPKAEKGKEVA